MYMHVPVYMNHTWGRFFKTSIRFSKDYVTLFSDLDDPSLFSSVDD